MTSDRISSGSAPGVFFWVVIRQSTGRHRMSKKTPADFIHVNIMARGSFSLFLWALVALAAIATNGSVLAASSSARSSKGKKTKPSQCPNAEQCKLATEEQLDNVWAYLRTTRIKIEGFVTIGGASRCDYPVFGPEQGFDNICSQDTTYSPRTTLVSWTACPSGFSTVIQTDCDAFAVDKTGAWISKLPLYESGSDDDVAACVLDTSGLPDGAVVRIRQTAMCSFYYGTTAKVAAPNLEERFAKKHALASP
jgi:hypothetical protein